MTLENLEKNINTLEKAKNLIYIAYKIRCKLFHGEKNPDLDVNQTIVEAADKVIVPIFNHIFAEDKNDLKKKIIM